ncbi:MAG: TPM domain-containing protein [Spirochaetaceae bacterium]|nr:TPM domain-containing protein [Spirochaetaceae bacterium]
MDVKIKKISLLLILFFCSIAVFALNVPKWEGPVLDLANVLSASEETELYDYLVSLERQTGIQMAVLTINSLEGNNIENYSIKVAENWKLGQEKEDNGALLVVSVGDRQLRIETGYGLESLLTDAKCGLIIRNVITPYFRNGDYGTGIINGIKNMAGIATEDLELVDNSVVNESSTSDSDDLAIAIFFFFVFIIILTASISSSKTNGKTGNKTIYMPDATFGNPFNSNGSSSFNSFGGFKGGGGGFGGGGASGGW